MAQVNAPSCCRTSSEISQALPRWLRAGIYCGNFSSVLSGFTFSSPLNALVLSHPLNACSEKMQCKDPENIVGTAVSDPRAFVPCTRFQPWCIFVAGPFHSQKLRK